HPPGGIGRPGVRVRLSAEGLLPLPPGPRAAIRGDSRGLAPQAVEPAGRPAGRGAGLPVRPPVPLVGRPVADGRPPVRLAPEIRPAVRPRDRRSLALAAGVL